MPSAKRPLLDGAMLRQRLAVLRRRLRVVASVRGAGFLIAIVLASVVVAGLLDWRWHLPDLVRATVLTATLIGGVFVFYRHLFRPLNAANDDLSLALRVEEQYPVLNDALASTVQFLERGEAPSSSSTPLQREAVKRALAQATGFDFAKVVNKRGLMSAVVAGGALTALAATLTVLAPILTRTALLRLADPFGGHLWPKKTQLDIETPRLRIGRNESFEVKGRVRGVVPPQAVIVFRFEGFPNLKYHCDIKSDAAGVGHLAARLEPGRVQRSFRFQVLANDAVSDEYRVEVLPPPSLIALDDKPSPQVRLSYPAYTKLPSPEQLSPGSGNIDAVIGTTARLRGRVDRPLKRAWIEFLPEPPSVTLSDIFVLWDGGRPWWQPVVAVLDDDKQTFTLDFTPSVNGMYCLHFEDDIGLVNSRLFELRLHADPAPTVNLERPSPSRDILSVLPTAELRLETIISDPQYAIRSAFVEYRTQRDERPRRLYLYDPAIGPAPLLSPWTGPAFLATSPMPLRPKRLHFRRKLAVSTLRHADDSALKEEDIVFLRVCADDFDDVNPNKEIGHSNEIEIHIVGRNALDLILNQAQAGVQQELLRLREKQLDALKKATSVENRLKKGEKTTAEDQENLLQAEQIQQQIRERVGNEKQGLRSDLKRIRDALKQNGMEKTAAQERMSDVSREIERLANNELQRIEPLLTNARKLAEKSEDKTRAERKAQLEARAKEAEQEAKKAEQSAARHEQEAADNDQKAEQSNDSAEKARHSRQAKQQHQRAEELRQKAGDLRRQAERDRRAAKEEPDPKQPLRTLTEARKAQEEVEKTLNDLLARRLEPWTSSHEIKGEAKRLLQEQKSLQAEVEKRKDADKGFLGKKPDGLNKAQRADLENLKDAQQKLEERTRQLLDKMDRIAKQREKKDPQTAGELQNALQKARHDGLNEGMKQARRRIEQNKLSEAANSQKENVKKLKELVKNLEDRREAELERLAKKLRRKEKELDDLIKEQEELRKKVKQAGKLGNKAQREEELKRLAKRQEQLQEKTEDMLKELTRLRASRAGEVLGQAGEQMKGAGHRLSRGQQSEDEQNEVLERLNEAKMELRQARKEAEDELMREQIERLAELIRPLKERQDTLADDTTHTQERVQRKGQWTRALQLGLQAKGRAQEGLAAETKKLTEQRLTNAAVFSRLMRRAGEAMTKAGQRMHAVAKNKVPATRLPDAETTRLQREAARRLTQVIGALKESAEKMRQAKGGSSGGGEGGSSPNGRGEGIPPLAQLRLLRDLQKEVNQRTETFEKRHPNLKKLEAMDKNELQSIRKDQQDVAELIDELTRPSDEPAPAQGDNK